MFIWSFWGRFASLQPAGFRARALPRLLRGDHRGVGGEHEVDTRVWDQVGLELRDVHVPGQLSERGLKIEGKPESRSQLGERSAVHPARRTWNFEEGPYGLLPSLKGPTLRFHVNLAEHATSEATVESQCPVKPQRRRQAGDDLGDEAVQVGVSGALDVQVPACRIESLRPVALTAATKSRCSPCPGAPHSSE